MKLNVGDILNLLSYREAVLMAEGELAGAPCSLETWTAQLNDTEREFLEVYDRSVQRAYDDIVSVTTGGLH